MPAIGDTMWLTYRKGGLQYSEPYGSRFGALGRALFLAAMPEASDVSLRDDYGGTILNEAELAAACRELVHATIH
ncbi:MAG: hypothetical protein ACREHE_15630 [Rhizomicrobium sp.]